MKKLVILTLFMVLFLFSGCNNTDGEKSSCDIVKSYEISAEKFVGQNVGSEKMTGVVYTLTFDLSTKNPDEDIKKWEVGLNYSGKTKELLGVNKSIPEKMEKQTDGFKGNVTYTAVISGVSNSFTDNDIQTLIANAKTETQVYYRSGCSTNKIKSTPWV
jgi:hypothetical protein